MAPRGADLSELGRWSVQQPPNIHRKEPHPALLDGSKWAQTLLVADYSSLEIGIAGDFQLRLFGDDQTVQAYIDQADKIGPDGKVIKGTDIHSNNARSVFGKWLGWRVPDVVMVDGKPVVCPYAGETVDAIPVTEFKKHPFGARLRDMIKAVFYGLAYGKGAYGFSTLIGADGRPIGEQLAEKMVNALLDAVPGMRAWFRWVEKFVRKHHGIYSLGGRWCDLSPEMTSGNEWEEKRAFRRAYNFPMQATGAEIIGDAMVRIGGCKEFRETGFRLCLQVHDELVARGPLANLELARKLMVGHMTSATANGTPLLFPVQVSSGHGVNYWEAK